MSNGLSGRAVDVRSFRELVLENDGPTLVIFTAGFCEASLKLLETMNELADAYDGRARVLNLDLGKDEANARTNRIARR